MNDAAGSSIMASDPGTYYPLTNPIDGEYKNGQDSGPIGVADDGDRARQFFGSTGYAYINGVSAPNWHGSQPYGNYTMEAWIYRSDHGDGTIMEFGRAGSVYISGDSVYFQNGDDVTTSGIPVNINQWYMVIAEKSANHLYLFVQASPSTPTACNPTQVSGSSLYRPEGAPTFYVGYGNQSGVGWFNGAIDEVVYFTRALTQFEYCAQYYADPVPDRSTMTATSGPAASTAANGGADGSGANPGGTTHKPTKKPLTKLQKARNQVKFYKTLVSRTRVRLLQLKFSHAPKRVIKKAEAALRDQRKRLAYAEKQLKKLEAQAKPKPKKPAPKKSAKRH